MPVKKPLECCPFPFDKDGKRILGAFLHGSNMTRDASRGPTPLQRERIFKRDGYACVYCGNTAEVIDHVIPYSYRKDSSDNNLVAACRVCNSTVSDCVFHSIGDKRRYILGVLAGNDPQDLIVTRGRYTKNKCYCADCKITFMPATKGATHLLCTRCARLAETGKKRKLKKLRLSWTGLSGSRGRR